MYTTDSTNIAVYNHLMKVAKEIALTNPKGLPDLIRAILRPLQSEHLLAVAERGQDALPNLDGAWFFGSAVRDRLFSTSGSRWLGRPLPQNQYVLKLPGYRASMAMESPRLRFSSGDYWLRQSTRRHEPDIYKALQP